MNEIGKHWNKRQVIKLLAHLYKRATPLVYLVLSTIILIQASAHANSISDSATTDYQEVEKILKDVRSHACSDRIQPNQTKQDHLEGSICKECSMKFISNNDTETSNKLKDSMVAVDAANEKNRAKRELAFYESRVFAEDFAQLPSSDPEGLSQNIKEMEASLSYTDQIIHQREEKLKNANAALAALQNYPAEGQLASPMREIVSAEVNQALEKEESELHYSNDLVEKYKKRLAVLDTMSSPSASNEKKQIQSKIERTQKSIQEKQELVGAMHALVDDQKSQPPTKSQLGEKLELVKKELAAGVEVASTERTFYQGFRDSKLKELKKLNDLLAQATEAAKHPKQDSTGDQAKLKKFESLTREKIVVQVPEFNPCGMSPAEIAALQYYTGSGYRSLNKALRETTDDVAKYAPTAEVLKSALKKLRRYNGFVRRGTTLPAEVLEKYKVGSTLVFNQFTSTSLSNGFGGNAKFIIHSKTGRYVGAISVASSENEVLFAPEARFKILSRKDDDGNSEFVLEELGDKPRPGGK